MPVLGFELGLAAVAAEVHGLAVVLERRRARDHGDGHVADRIDGQRRERRGRAVTASVGPAFSRPPPAVAAGRDDARRGSRARSRPGCGRRCRAPPGRRYARAARRARRRRAARPRRPAPRLGLATRPTYGRPDSSPHPQRVQLVAAVGGDDQREITRARLERRRPPPARLEPELSAEPQQGAGDRRLAHDQDRWAGSIGSRNTSIAPPERHGFWTVTAPSASLPSSPLRPASASSSKGTMRSSTDSPVSHRLERVGADAVLGAHAAHEALDRPVLEHERHVARGHAGRDAARAPPWR